MEVSIIKDACMDGPNGVRSNENDNFDDDNDKKLKMSPEKTNVVKTEEISISEKVDVVIKTEENDLSTQMSPEIVVKQPNDELVTKSEDNESSMDSTSVIQSDSAAPMDKNDNVTTSVEQSKEPDSSSPMKIPGDMLEGVTERLKFFFSEANVRHDFFVRRLLLNTEEGTNPGHVPIEALLRFNTIKRHTTDPTVIVQVVETILSDRLKLSDDKLAVTTVVPFTKDKMDGNIPRSIYLTNVPYDDHRYTCTVDEIKVLFEQYGPVALVKLRYQPKQDNDKPDNNNEGDNDHDNADIQPSTRIEGGRRKRRKTFPIGAAFVEFETEEALQAAANDVLTVRDGTVLEPKRKVLLHDKELQCMLLKEFISSIRKRKAPSENAEDEKGTNDAVDKTPDNNSASNTNNTNNKGGSSNNASEKQFHLDWKTGCVIRLKGVDSDRCDRETLLDAIGIGLGNKTAADVKALSVYVDYSRGQLDGAVRFRDPTDADIPALCAKFASGELTVAGKTVASAYILEGDEESQYWKDFIEFKTRQINSDRRNKGHNHHNNKRHNRSNHNDNRNHNHRNDRNGGDRRQNKKPRH